MKPSRTPSPRRATVVGTGLIGGSIGLALRERGWHVSGVDQSDKVIARGVELGALDASGFDPSSELVVIATPVGSVPEMARLALEECRGATVTDVAGVKAWVLEEVPDPRFVGGHPMAGSEQLGLEGATPDLFRDAAWVLCPHPEADDSAYASVREMAMSLGANVLTMDAVRHDALVAVVSHVPHLTAASLVALAAERSKDHPALLRLAAGGFRDMTRISAGNPAIWPDVCAQNRSAILETIDELISGLERYRQLVDDGDSNALLQELSQAQTVRRSLPSRADDVVTVAALRVPIPDTPGAVALVAGLATDVGVNLRSLQTIDATDTGGVLEVLVASDDAPTLLETLRAQGYRAVIVDDGTVANGTGEDQS